MDVEDGSVGSAEPADSAGSESSEAVSPSVSVGSSPLDHSSANAKSSDDQRDQDPRRIRVPMNAGSTSDQEGPRNLVVCIDGTANQFSLHVGSSAFALFLF